VFYNTCLLADWATSKQFFFFQGNSVISPLDEEPDVPGQRLRLRRPQDHEGPARPRSAQKVGQHYILFICKKTQSWPLFRRYEERQ
jgi:hypothetical protein